MNILTNTTEDIVYIGSQQDQVYSVTSGFNGSVNYDYFCSISGASITTGIFDPLGSSNVTLWISTNPDFATLTVNAPIVSVDTNYTFGVYFVDGSNNITAQDIITVFACNVANCETCDLATKDSLCSSCEQNYTLSADSTTCSVTVTNNTNSTNNSTNTTTPVNPTEPTNTTEEETPSATSESLSTASITATVVTTSVAAASSMSGLSSGQSIWSLVNQYQLVILIPLLNTYLGQDFRFYITEFRFISLDFDFMSVVEIPYLDPLVERLNYDQSEEVFANNGIESGSFVNNHYGLFKVLSIISILSIIFWLFK